MLTFQATSALLIAYKQWPMSLTLSTFGEKQRSVLYEISVKFGGKKQTETIRFE